MFWSSYTEIGLLFVLSRKLCIYNIGSQFCDYNCEYTYCEKKPHIYKVGLMPINLLYP